MVWYPDDTDLEPKRVGTAEGKRGTLESAVLEFKDDYKLMVTIETIIYTILYYFITEFTRIMPYFRSNHLIYFL